MEAKDMVLSKAEMKEALIKAGCPEELIYGMGKDIQLWWKAGWIQEILLAQKKAGQEEEYKRWVKFAMMVGICLDQPQQLKRIIPQIKGAERKAGQDSVFDSIPENLPPLLETAHRTAKQEGIKLVVEAVNAELVEADSRNMWYLNKGFWQELKERLER